MPMAQSKRHPVEIKNPRRESGGGFLVMKIETLRNGLHRQIFLRSITQLD